MKDFFILLKTEFLKQKRGFFWPMVLLAPVSLGAMIFVDIYLRYDYLASRYEGFSSWQIMLLEGYVIWFLMFSLAVVMMCALIFYVEYAAGGLKYTISLPTGRDRVYFAKWFFCVIASYVMILLQTAALIAVGKILHFPEPLDYMLFIKHAVYQFAAVLGVISLQIYMGSITDNIILPLSIGTVGIATAIFFAQDQRIARFIPYAYEIFTLPLPGENNTVAVMGGLVGIALLLLGAYCFKKKDIKV